jgi:hypothetical protein
MSKHTPGPWMIDEDVDFVAGCLAISDGGGCICHVEKWEYEDEETQVIAKANARLIAESPNMLEAINEADTAFAVINMCDDLTPQAKSALREAWAKVQAILVKLSPDGALAEAVKETPTSAYNLMNPSKEAQDQFPLEDWQYEVMNGDTKRGYNEWLAVQLEDCQHTL